MATDFNYSGQIKPGATPAEVAEVYGRERNDELAQDNIKRQFAEQERIRQQQLQQAQEYKKQQNSLLAQAVKDTVIAGAAITVAHDIQQQLIDNQNQKSESEQLNRQKLATAQQEQLAHTSLADMQATAATNGLNPVIAEQIAQQNAVPTPVVNHFESRTSHIPNSPLHDQMLEQHLQAQSLIDPQLAQKDLAQTLKVQRQDELQNAIYKAYDVDMKTRETTENDLQTAHEVMTNLYSAQNKQQSSNTTSDPDRINQVLELRTNLQKQIEKTAIANGQSNQTAKDFSHEMTAAFIAREAERRRQEELKLMNDEHKRVQEEQTRLTKNQLRVQLDQDRLAQQSQKEALENPDAYYYQTRNIDPKTLNLVEQKHKDKQLQPGSSGGDDGITYDKDGNVVDPHYKQRKDYEIDNENGKFVLNSHQVVAYEGATSVAAKEFTARDVGFSEVDSITKSRTDTPRPRKPSDNTEPVLPQSISTIDHGYNAGGINTIGPEPPVRHFGSSDFD